MARVCPITNKSYQKTVRRSHSMQSTIDRRNPNFIVKRIGNKKVKLTAAALRLAKKKNVSIVSLLNK